MAVDQTIKRQNLARKLMADAIALKAVLDALTAHNNDYVKSGITFIASDFTGADLIHLDVATVTNFLTSATTIQSFITTNNHDVNIDKMGP